MKTTFLAFCILWLFTLPGCLKEEFPIIKNITTGSKWNLRIGNSFEDIYKNLQDLGIDKKFSSISLVDRQAFHHPSEIKESLPYYHVLTVSSSVGRVDRVIIHIKDGHVTSLEAGATENWKKDVQHTQESIDQLQCQ